MHNKVITNELDAWLAIMAYDEPERIMELAETYPECRAVYEEIYDMCRNIEGVMRMYSKELAELDRNTVKYMIEEQEKVIKAQKEQLNQQEATLKELTEEIEMLKGAGKQ